MCRCSLCRIIPSQRNSQEELVEGRQAGNARTIPGWGMAGRQMHTYHRQPTMTQALSGSAWCCGEVCHIEKGAKSR